jgi:hypothetical protein
MYNSDTELLFPIRVISTLGALRGEPWRELVARFPNPHAESSDQLAFVLMMVRLGDVLPAVPIHFARCGGARSAPGKQSGVIVARIKRCLTNSNKHSEKSKNLQQRKHEEINNFRWQGDWMNSSDIAGKP